MLTFLALLLLAGSDDVQARLLNVSVQSITWVYRFAVWLLPPLAFAIAWRVCIELQARHAYEADHPLARRARAHGGRRVRGRAGAGSMIAAGALAMLLAMAPAPRATVPSNPASPVPSASPGSMSHGHAAAARART